MVRKSFDLERGVVTLERAKSYAVSLGAQLVNNKHGGEVLLIYDDLRCRVNNRRKDAPRSLLKFIRKVKERVDDVNERLQNH